MAMKETAANRSKDLIRKLDQTFEKLEQEVSRAAMLSPSVLDDLEGTKKRLSDAYTRALKATALQDDEEAAGSLEEVLSNLVDHRVKVLSVSADTALQRMERILRSPFWYGERGAYLRSVAEIRRNLRDVESSDMGSKIDVLNVELDRLLTLDNQLQTDERRARIRLPLQILFWGLPIVVGVWVSDKLTRTQNLVIFSTLIVTAFLVYCAIRFQLPSRISRILLFRPIVKLSPMRTALLLQFPIVLLVVGASSAPGLDDYIVRSRMKATLGALPAEVMRGSELRIPYGVQFNHETPAVGILISLEAPGLLTNGKTAQINALAGNRVEHGEFVLRVPSDIPPGLYDLELKVHFTANRSLPLPGIKRRRSRNVTEIVEITVK